MTTVRPIDTMLIVPSEDLREIAMRHRQRLPLAIRSLLRGVGGPGKGESKLLSFLLFERAYTRELIALGYRDAMARREEIEAFLAGESIESPARVTGWRDLIEEYTAKLPILRVSGQE